MCAATSSNSVTQRTIGSTSSLISSRPLCFDGDHGQKMSMDLLQRIVTDIAADSSMFVSLRHFWNEYSRLKYEDMNTNMSSSGKRCNIRNET